MFKIQSVFQQMKLQSGKTFERILLSELIGMPTLSFSINSETFDKF